MKHSLEQIQKQVIGRQLSFVAPLERGALDKDARTVEIAITSDKPIQHWFGRLILDHSAKSIRMERMKAGAPALLEHDRSQKIGGLMDARTDGHVLRATVKFSRCPEADREIADIEDGIPRSISGGFVIHDLKLESEDSNGERTYRSSDWEPLEASFVTIPADISVGVGRTLETRDEDEPHGDDCECEQCADKRENSEENHESERSEMSEPQTRAQETTPRVESITERSKMNFEELLKLGDQFNCRAAVEDYLLSTEQPTEAGVKTAIREQRAKAQTELPKPQPRVDFQPKDAKRYSIARAIKLAAGIDAEECGFEAEISREIEKNLDKGITRNGGIFIPTGMPREVLKRAGLDTATSTAGAEAVFTEYAGFIDYLYNRAKVLMLGATTLTGLQGNVSFLKQTGKTTAAWRAENPGSDASDSNLTTDLVTLSPKTLIASTSFSRQLLNQSVVNIESLVQADLAKTMALAVDRAAIHGAGSSNEPLGLYGISGVNSKAFGGAMTKALLTDMKTLIAEDNADIGDLGFLTTPGAVGVGEKTLEFSASGSRPLYVDGKLTGIRCEASNQVSAVMNGSTATGGSSHGIILGVWPEFLWGEWGAMEVIVDPYRLKKQAMIEITSFLMCDFDVKHPEAFCKGTGQTV